MELHIPLSIRANKEQLELLRNASKKVGLSLSALLRSASIKEAKRILKEDNASA